MATNFLLRMEHNEILGITIVLQASVDAYHTIFTRRKHCYSNNGLQRLTKKILRVTVDRTISSMESSPQNGLQRSAAAKSLIDTTPFPLKLIIEASKASSLLLMERRLISCASGGRVSKWRCHWRIETVISAALVLYYYRKTT